MTKRHDITVHTVRARTAPDPRGLTHLEQPRSTHRSGAARAYRAGRLVCGWAHVTISLDERVGLTPDERRVVRVRFLEPLDDHLRTELIQLVRRHGSAAYRAAERINPIELVVDDPNGKPQRVRGRLQPPHVRHGQLRDIEFGLCELKSSR